MVSPWGNHFYDLCSLSSLTRLPHHHFTYLIRYLIEIETTINSPLEVHWHCYNASTEIDLISPRFTTRCHSSNQNPPNFSSNRPMHLSPLITRFPTNRSSSVDWALTSLWNVRSTCATRLSLTSRYQFNISSERVKRSCVIHQWRHDPSNSGCAGLVWFSSKLRN